MSIRQITDEERELFNRIDKMTIECEAWRQVALKVKASHTKLFDAITKVYKAKGRYHSQLAMCDLYDLCDLPNERPTK